MSTAFSTRQPEKVGMGFQEAQIPHGASAVPVMVQNVSVVGVDDGQPAGGAQSRQPEVVMCNTLSSTGGRWQHLADTPPVGDGGQLSRVNEVELAPGVQLPGNGVYTVLGQASANGTCKLVVHEFVPAAQRMTRDGAKNRLAQLVPATA